MNTMGGLFRWCQWSEKKEVGNATERGRRRALVKFGSFWSVLALVVVTSVTSPPASHAAFPGANGKIAFESNRDGDSEIWVMNADGSSPTQLTTTGCESTPRWSPDGTKITFTSCRDNNQEIYVMNADGTDQTRLTNNAAQDRAPNWSADGTKIIFQSDRDKAANEMDIYTVNVDGTGVAIFFGTSRQEQQPAWAPNDTKIAFVDSTGCCDHRLKTINTDGTSPAFLSPSLGSLNAVNPEWSPDSQTIAFAGFIPGVTNVQIYTIKADGTSTAATLLTPPASLTVNGAAAYSPDGAKIAFVSSRDGDNEIYVMNADGSSPANLTSSPSSSDTAPDWQPLPIPFAAFDAKVEIELGPLANDDKFELKDTFTLGSSSDGLDIPVEIVSLQLTGGTGASSASIPAGNFEFHPAKPGKKGKPGKPAFFTFEGVINGVDIEVKITDLGGGSFEFKAEGTGADLTGMANPVTVKLTIGDDGGSTMVEAEFE